MGEGGSAGDEVRAAAVAVRRLLVSVEDIRRLVPRGLRVSAAVGWRLLIVVAALYVLGTVAGYLASLVVPVAIALLLAALLAPAVGFLTRHRMPRALATVVVLVGGLVVVGGVLTFVVLTFVNGLPALRIQLSASIDAVVTWLTNGPLHLSDQQFTTLRDKIIAALNANQAGITAGALTTAGTVGEFFAETLLALFTLIFFLYDGTRIWRFLLHAAPTRIRPRIDLAGQRSHTALVSYVRATAAVAVVDAVGIGVGLAILGIPLAVSLAALVFLGAFIPVIGAVLAGGVAVLVALVTKGLLHAVIVLAIVIAVMQLEGHVLQPLLLGRAVNLHPLAVVLAIATGLLTAGIIGALLAVPLLAVLSAATRSLRTTSPTARTETEPADPLLRGTRNT